MRAWVHDGKTTLLSTIVTGVPSLLPWVVWDVDGPLITGIRENDDTCALNDALGAVNDGRWILSVRDSRSGTFSDFSTGIVAGNIDDLAPHVAMQFTEKEAPALAVSGALGIIEQTGGPLRLLDWNDPTKRTVLPSDAFAQNFAFTFGSALFWGASGSDYNTQKIYTAEAGAKDFILGGNSPPAAADLATDGTDFAWTEGSGGWTSEGLPTTVNVMTAPFTTDHTKLKPRRLRSEQTYGFGTTPFVVGCGYAMRGITVAMRIVRLSDGVSWLLNKTANWTWETGVAINCAEAFIDVIELPAGRRGKTDGGGLVRIRLDSLGPGIAPD